MRGGLNRYFIGLTLLSYIVINFLYLFFDSVIFNKNFEHHILMFKG